MVSAPLPPALGGQEGAFSVQIRGGGAVPLGSFRNESEGWEGRARTGPSLALGFNLPFPGPTDAHIGFSQHRFGCDESLCPDGESWTSTGFDLALRLVLGGRRLRTWIQGGLHTHRIEVRILEEGEPAGRVSDGSYGMEVGGGILVQIGNRMSLSPGIRYGRGRVPFPEHPDLHLRYVVADLGLVVGF